MTPLSLGNVGVFLFFVVSGFVIAEALDLFYRGRLGAFLVNRGLKIFPAYWAALIVAGLAALATGQAVPATPWPATVNLSLVLAALPGAGGLLLISVAWAVIVEVQFYLLAGFGTAAGARRPRASFLALSLGALLLYLLVAWSDGHARFYGAFQFAPFFVFGATFYVLLARREARLVLLLAAALGLSIHAFFNYVGRNPAIAAELATAIFAVLCLVFVLLPALPPGARLERLDKRLGDLTYALYLVHMSVIALALHLGLQGRTGFAAVASGALAAASLIHIAVERPLWRVRDRMRGRAL